jgi:hypothetical protein
MWIEGSRRLYEAGSRRRGVWPGASLCLSLCFCSFFLDLELCASWARDVEVRQGRGSSGGGWRVWHRIPGWAKDRSRYCVAELN